LGENGEKMSKSRGNVINPDDMIDEIGADAFRMYEMFMGAFDQAIPWNTNGARGCKRFLDRVWRLQSMVDDQAQGLSKTLRVNVNSCIKKVTEDFERMKFNTAIAALMTLVNDFYLQAGITAGDLKALLLLLSPVSPHICEEIWQRQGYGEPLYQQPWPSYDEAYLVEDQVEIAVQINGKIRGKLFVPSDLGVQEGQESLARNEQVQKLLGGMAIVKLFYVPGRLLNIVAR
jgi:leucyl-tRNA synthetase